VLGLCQSWLTLDGCNMPAKYFERELIHEWDDEGNLDRLQRMTFTPSELRGICVMLSAGAGVVGYGFVARTIVQQFQNAWSEVEGYRGVQD
jgi:hypothetical protein